MLRRLTRSDWLLAGVALTVFLAGCKNGSGGSGY